MSFYEGAWYTAALVGSRFARLYGDSHIDTHLGRVELDGVQDAKGNTGPENPLHLVIHDYNGVFYIAGQSSRDRGAILISQASGAWKATGIPAIGVNACIFVGPLLLVNIGGNQYKTYHLETGAIGGPFDHPLVDGKGLGSQGFMYVKDGVPVARDVAYGQHGLAEFIDIGGGWFLGQGCGPDAGVVASWFGEESYQLDPGNSEFIRVDQQGDTLAIACVKTLRGSFIRECSVQDLKTFPKERKSGDQPPLDPPTPPDPPKEPPVSEVDQTPTALDRLVLDELVTQRPNYPDPMPADRSARNDALGEYLNHTVGVLQSRGLQVWLEKKAGNPDSDNCARLPGTNQGIANDIVQTEEGGKRYGRDFLSATDPGEPARPSMGFKGYAERDKGIDPVPSGVVVPPKPPDNPPPAGNWEARLASVEARLGMVGSLMAALDGVRSDVAVLGSKVHDLEEKPSGSAEDLARALQGVARKGDPVTLTANLPLVGGVRIKGKIDD